MTTLVPKYDQGATGAVNRPFNLKLAEIVSVKDFGALGDGTTDDTAAIQAALTTGNDVYVPDGTYKVTSTLTLATGFQTIYGAGRGGSIISFTFASSGSVGVSVTNSTGNQTVRDLTFTVASNCAKLIDILAPQVNIWNCYIYNATVNGTAIYSENEDAGADVYIFAARIINTNIHGNNAAGSTAISLGLNSQATIIQGNTIDNYETLISIRNATSALTIRDNILEANSATATAIAFGSTGSPTYYDVRILENYFEANLIVIKLATNSTYSNLVISNNYATGTNSAGYIFFTAPTGITVGAGSQNIIIENNFINSYHTIFNIDDTLNYVAPNIISTKGNSLSTYTNYATGTWANYVYQVKTVNAYFGNVVTSGAFTSQAINRLEGVNMTFRTTIPLAFKDKPVSLQFKYTPATGNLTFTATVYSQILNTTASVGTVTGAAEGTYSITISPSTNPIVSYFIEFNFAAAGGGASTAYVYPFNLYLFE